MTMMNYLPDLLAARVNIMVEFYVESEDSVLFNVRATHWKGSSDANVMYLVADYDLNDAMVRLANSISCHNTVKLDWKARLATPGDLGDFQRSKLIPLPRYQSVVPQDAS